MTEEYSVAIWKKGQCLLQRCVGAGEAIQTQEDAAAWGYSQGVSLGIIAPGSAVEVDVSEDASDDWTTHILENYHGKA